MVKLLKEFECEVCHTRYGDEERAHRCETQPKPGTSLKVGDWVGYGAHGWWGTDTSWALVSPVPPPSHPGENQHPSELDKRATWTKPTGNENRNPVHNWWLPIYRVISITDDKPWASVGGIARHSVSAILWTPRHANGGPERVVKVRLEGGRFLPGVTPDLVPAMTTEETAKYEFLIGKPPSAEYLSY